MSRADPEPQPAGPRVGVEPGVEADGSGRAVPERTENRFGKYAGIAPPGTFPPGYLRKLRAEWHE